MKSALNTKNEYGTERVLMIDGNVIGGVVMRLLIFVK